MTGPAAKRTCEACRTVLPAAELERVPTRPHLARCLDAVACWRRFAPRPLPSSKRWPAWPGLGEP